MAKPWEKAASAPPPQTAPAGKKPWEKAAASQPSFFQRQGQRMVSMGTPQQAAPSAPDPNAPNPITTAMRQSTAQVNSQFAAQKAEEERRRQERTIFNSASPGLAFRDTGSKGTVELNDDGGDFGKGMRILPIHAQRAAVGAAEAALNTPGDLAAVATVPYAMSFDPEMQGIMAGSEFGVGADTLLERIAGRVKSGGFDKMQQTLDNAPRFDFSAAKIPVPESEQSFTGALTEGFMQYLIARGAVGKFAPGGKLPTQLAKDVAATGLGFSGNTPRLADMLDPESMGFAADYIRWLKSQPGETGLVGRVKNMAEDATLNLIGMGIFRGAKASADAMSPQALTPTNAGGANLGPEEIAQAVSTFDRLTPPVAPSTVHRFGTGPAKWADGEFEQLIADAKAGAYGGKWIGPETDPPLQPSLAPVTTPAVPQAPVTPAQAGPAGAGQQPAAGPQPVLNTVQTAPTVSKAQAREAKDTAVILGRILRAGGIKNNAIRGYLPGLIQRYESLGDSRIPLARFIERDLPQHFPEGVAGDAVAKLRGFGRERDASTGPKDTSRYTLQDTKKKLRSSQQDHLTEVIRSNTYRKDLIDAEDKIKADMRKNAEAGYETALANGLDRFTQNRAAPDEVAAFEQMRSLIASEPFLSRVPDHVKVRAIREGKPLEEAIAADPVRTAHWLQSALGKAERAAQGMGGKATPESLLYSELREAVLDPLQKAVPGYKGARNAHGDLFGADEALEFGEDLFLAARSEVETARKARDFGKLSKQQQTVATMSIRDKLLNEFRGTPEDAAAKLTRMQQEGVLDAIERILGADGKRITAAIRETVEENDWLRSIDQGSGSPTFANAAGARDAAENVRGPINKAVGSLGDKRTYLGAVVGDVVLSSVGVPPVLTVGKATSDVVGAAGRPSARQLSNATKGLFGLPEPKPPATPPTRAPRGPRKPKAPEQLEADLETLLKRYDEIDHRNNPTESARVLKQIDALKKRLAKPPATTAPRRPPEQAGFVTPGALVPVVGAGLGATLAPDTNGDGVVDAQERMAGGMGGLISGSVLAGAGHAVGKRFFGKSEWSDIGPPLTGDELTKLMQANKPITAVPPYSRAEGAGANRLLGPRRGAAPKVKPSPAAPSPPPEQFVPSPPTPGKLRAYHGSPHSFDAFESSNIGTGEGAASYGRGLYFAENPDVAKSYQSKLSRRDEFIDGERFDYLNPRHVATKAVRERSWGTVDDAIGALQYQRKGTSGQERKVLDEAIRLLKSGAPVGKRTTQTHGTLYEVDIDASADDFLDWDKPLGSQTARVKQALEQTDAPAIRENEPLGEYIGRLGRKASEDVMDRLKAAGVPGIRYLDQGSRGVGEGSRNLVLFDDKRVSVVNRFGGAAPKAGPRTGSGFGTEADYLRSVKEGDEAFRASAEKITQAGGFGDYKVSLRYPIDSELRGASFNVTKNGEVVGTFDLYSPGHTQELSLHAAVKPEFQRQGIATQFYDFVERSTGKKLRKSETMSPEGKALWDARERGGPQKPPAQSGFGGGPTKGQPRPLMSGKVISELERAKKTLPPQVRSQIAANAARPSTLRVSAAEATGDDPSLYTLAAPFQRTRKGLLGRNRPNAVETSVREGMARVDAGAGKPPPLDEAGEAMRLSERQRRAAKSAAQTTANKLNPYVNEAAGIPDKPLPKSVAAREQEATELAITARKLLEKHRLTANEYEQAVAQANARKAEIADALLTGRIAPPNQKGLLPGSSGQTVPPRSMKPVSQREAEEMAELLFNRENAEMLDAVLSGRVTPRNRDRYHAALLLAAGSAVGTASIATVLGDIESAAQRRRDEVAAKKPKPTYEDPGDPRFVWDWDKIKSTRNKHMEDIQIKLNALPPNASGGKFNLNPDGIWRENKETDRAIRKWLYDNGFDPNEDFTMEHWDILTEQFQEAQLKRGPTRAAPSRRAPERTPTP